MNTCSGQKPIAASVTRLAINVEPPCLFLFFSFPLDARVIRTFSLRAKKLYKATLNVY